MEPLSLSHRIHQGFLAVIRPGVIAALGPLDREIAGVCVADLPAAVRPGADQQVRDKLWRRVLRRYRTGGSRSFWGPVILEMLAPALIAQLAELFPIPPGLAQEDLEQQMLVEALAAAATMPFPRKGRMIEQRLARRASWMALKALFAEADHRSWTTDLSEVQMARHVMARLRAKTPVSVYSPRRSQRRRRRGTGGGSAAGSSD